MRTALPATLPAAHFTATSPAAAQPATTTDQDQEKRTPLAKTGHAFPEPADAPLQKWQKARLAIWCRKGYDADREAGQTLDQYRWLHVLRATGGRCHGLRAARQADWKDLEAHFAALAGEVPRAMNAGMQLGRAAANKRTAVERLTSAMNEFSLPFAYVQAVAVGKFCGALSHLDANTVRHAATLVDMLGPLEVRQVWALFYTIRNRGHARAGKGHDENRNKSQRADAQLARALRHLHGDPAEATPTVRDYQLTPRPKKDADDVPPENCPF